MIFGESKLFAVGKASIDNWENICEFVKKVVEDQIKTSKAKVIDEGTSTCIINLMLTSDVYKENIDAMINDLIMVMLAANDTSRNTTITALCHLAKNSTSTFKVRSEISACMTKYGIEQNMKLSHK